MLENLSAAPAKAYSSVQYGPEEHDHLELNSDLLFSTSTPLSPQPGATPLYWKRTVSESWTAWAENGYGSDHSVTGNSYND